MSAEIHPVRDRPIIVGAGLAGLGAALALAPEPVIVLSRAALGQETSSAWAQGGLAASLGADDDPLAHLADTLAAGSGLCDAAVAARVTAAAPEAIAALERFGAVFDRDEQGALRLGLEAAHSRRRIVHAKGDGTGREVMRALIAAVRRTPSITLIEGLEARRLIVGDDGIVGLVAAGPSGAVQFASRRVVIATGGIGGLYQDSTNPLGSFGQGLALAARAGAAFADLEFVQFHPTAFDGPARPMPLISEAVRGEGAVLIDETGRRFMAEIPGAELAPRDVVARAVWHELARGHRVFLDARQHPGADFAERFPAIAAACRSAGIDPAVTPIPIRPAEHYHMGGLVVDADGRTTVQGLWAAGEAAATGLHGANRLASNSLTEAVVTAGWVARSVAAVEMPPARLFRPAPLLPAADAAPVRPIMTRDVGVLRDRNGLIRAIDQLMPLAAGTGPAADPATVGLMIAAAALARTESRGAHCRTDFPQTAAEPRRSRITLAEAFATAREVTGATRMLAR